MLLLAIKNHLKHKSRQTLGELSYYFQVESNVLQEILNLLIRKGQVRRSISKTQCTSPCQACNVVTTELYEWVSLN